MNPTSLNNPSGGSRPMITRAFRPPNWLCSKSNQCIVLLRDASGSMEGAKSRDASAACQDLINELAQPANRDGFHVAVANFAERAALIHEFEKATSLVAHLEPLGSHAWRKSPGADCAGTTNITAGLAQARQALDRVAARPPTPDIHFLRPVVLLFSDGCHNEGPPPEVEASNLRQQADLVTVAFGTDADEDLLRSLATSPQHSYRCASGRELRQFLAAVGATLTQTMAQRSNATRALAEM